MNFPFLIDFTQASLLFITASSGHSHTKYEPLNLERIFEQSLDLCLEYRAQGFLKLLNEGWDIMSLLFANLMN